MAVIFSDTPTDMNKLVILFIFFFYLHFTYIQNHMYAFEIGS